MLDVVEACAQVLRENRRAVLATVTEVKGASPARPGFKLLVQADGVRIGNVGGGSYRDGSAMTPRRCWPLPEPVAR